MRDWRNLRYRIYGFEVRCAAIIGKMVSRNASRGAVLNRLRSEMAVFLRTVSLREDEVAELWKAVRAEYVSVLNKVRRSRKDDDAVYESIRRTLPDLEDVKNRIGSRAEESDKKSYLDDLVSDGIFYLCSEHADCAEDHRDYQGRIYVSSDWRERCRSDEERKRVGAYIRNHGCRTVEWVTWEPVYMVTRPHCRHYFIRLDTDEVLGRSVRSILRGHGMSGLRSEERSGYSYDNYRAYYERMKLLIGLRGVCPCLQLEKDIDKTRRIMKKWLAELDR